MSLDREGQTVDDELIYTKSAPVTLEWRSHVPPSIPALKEAGVARATYAPTQETPFGTTEVDWREKHQNQTVRPLFLNQCSKLISEPFRSSSSIALSLIAMVME